MNPLQTVRQPLFDLHRALLESQRREYERANGRTSPAEFLQALITDPAYAWLKPLTTVVASLDEFLGDAESRQRYADALQGDAEVLLAHARLKQALRPAAATASA